MRRGVVESLEGPSLGTGTPRHSEIFLPSGQKFSGIEAQLVLFEVPPPAPIDKGGRPKWEKAIEYQELVEAMCDFGASLAQIEAAVGVSGPTLRLNFSGTPAWQEWTRRRRAWRSGRKGAGVSPIESNNAAAEGGTESKDR